MASEAQEKSQEKFPDQSAAKQSRLCSRRVTVDVSALSDRGKVRPNNEDHYLIARFGRSLQTLMTNLPEGSIASQVAEIGYAMIVADGMGGMAGGDVASRASIDSMVSLALNTPDWILLIGEREADEIMRRMEERFRKVNEALIKEAASDERLKGMGTTMTLAASLGTNLFIGHVGDSRAYLLRDGVPSKLTRDHTLVQQLIDTGVVAPQDAFASQYGSILTQALGSKQSELKPEVQRIHLADGDQLLLCTDGLTDMVDERTIASVLREEESATGACRALVALALEHGGRDNVTVVNARYRIQQLENR